MHHFTRFLGAALCAGLLAACGGGAGAPLPATQTETAPLSGAPPGESGTLTTQALTTPSTITNSGTIAGIRTGGGLTLSEGTLGYVPIAYTSSTIVNTYAATASVGHYAVLAGTGSTHTGITATYVAAYSSAPSTVTLTGTLTAMTSYGFSIHTSTHGTTPIVTTGSTTVSGSPATGGTVTVTGIGSPSNAVFASSVSASGATSSAAPSTPPPVTTTAMKHVLTAGYLGTPWGTTRVSPSQAAPYLTWAQTAIGNVDAIAAAGIKTMVYFNANKTQTKDPLYKSSGEANFSHSCTSARVTDYFDSVTQYLMNNASPAMRANYASYVASVTSGHHVDAVFEDDAVPPSNAPAGFYKPGMPCSYLDAAWLANEQLMQAGLNHNTIFNGLNRLNGQNVSLTVAELNNSKTIGGDYESCFLDSSNKKEGVWVWAAVENTQLQVTAKGKLFQCMGRDTTAASSAAASRIYAIASFLLTFNPAYSVLWESYVTPSGLSVMPESQLVPTQPLVATPTDVSALKKSTGVYVREYHSCSYKGTAIGPCAMVVNSDYYSHATPAFSQTYHHSLALSGNGVLDGGTVSFAGAAPPTTMASETAFVALP